MTADHHRIRPAIRQRARELRQPQTPAEERLWAHLRNRQLAGLKFRRQHAIGRFIVDFYFPERRLVVEVDGDSHADQAEYDQARTEWLSDQGYHVIRFTNREVERQTQAVLEAIERECHAHRSDLLLDSAGGDLSGRDSP
jgi:very-short-patch-repair endonuclease